MNEIRSQSMSAVRARPSPEGDPLFSGRDRALQCIGSARRSTHAAWWPPEDCWSNETAPGPQGEKGTPETARAPWYERVRNFFTDLPRKLERREQRFQMEARFEVLLEWLPSNEKFVSYYSCQSDDPERHKDAIEELGVSDMAVTLRDLHGILEVGLDSSLYHRQLRRLLDTVLGKQSCAKDARTVLRSYYLVRHPDKTMFDPGDSQRYTRATKNLIEFLNVLKEILKEENPALEKIYPDPGQEQVPVTWKKKARNLWRRIKLNARKFLDVIIGKLNKFKAWMSRR